MNAPEPIGVIFDMDGVLVDSAGPHFQSWQMLTKENDRTVTEQQFATTFGQHNLDIIPKLFGPISDERIRKLSDRKEDIYRDLVREEAPIVPGAVELVRALHGAGVQLAVGSSGPLANIELILRAMGVREMISVIVSGDDVTRGKPDPQVFSLACERLDIPPSRCVIVEDAPSGVEAGRAAGAHVVAILMYHPAEAFEHADRIVSRLGDVTVKDIVALVGE